MELFSGLEQREIRVASRRDDQWFEFSEAFELGPVELDKLANSLGMRDWSRMSQTTLPIRLLKEGDPFFTNLRKISPIARKMTEASIVARIKQIK